MSTNGNEYHNNDNNGESMKGTLMLILMLVEEKKADRRHKIAINLSRVHPVNGVI